MKAFEAVVDDSASRVHRRIKDRLIVFVDGYRSRIQWTYRITVPPRLKETALPIYSDCFPGARKMRWISALATGTSPS
ncbi:MAG: hypothetical protein QM674_21535 [Burkholderiaceae bacterium]